MQIGQQTTNEPVEYLNVPGTPTSPSKPIQNQPRASLFKTLVDTLPIDSIPRLRPHPERRQTSEGLIAPRSPNPSRLSGGPLPSPGLRSLNDLPPSPRLMTSETLSPAFRLSPPPRRGPSPVAIRRSTEEGPGRIGLGLRRPTSDSGHAR